MYSGNNPDNVTVISSGLSQPEPGNTDLGPEALQTEGEEFEGMFEGRFGSCKGQNPVALGGVHCFRRLNHDRNTIRMSPPLLTAPSWTDITVVVAFISPFSFK